MMADEEQRNGTATIEEGLSLPVLGARVTILERTAGVHTDRLGRLEGRQESFDLHLMPSLTRQLDRIEEKVDESKRVRELERKHSLVELIRFAVERFSEPETLKVLIIVLILAAVGIFGLSARYGEFQVGPGSSGTAPGGGSAATSPAPLP